MSSFFQRLREARVVRVLLVYAAASWVVLEATSVFIEQFGLPGWFFPAATLLLAIGLIILLATAWMQARPAARAPDVPTPWEVDLVDLKESVRRGQVPHLTWARAILGGVFAFSLLFGFAGLYVLLTGRVPTVPGYSITAHSSRRVFPGRSHRCATRPEVFKKTGWADSAVHLSTVS